LLYTLFLCVLVPVYWASYGPKNFLWFSDIALLTTAAALWLESPLVASMMALAVALPELAWNLDFFGRLLTGHHILDLSRYMFDSHKSLSLRALSLFHVALPVVLIWMIYRLGYDRCAWAAQTVVALIVLPVTYWLTDPADNINWVYGPGIKPQAWMPPWGLPGPAHGVLPARSVSADTSSAAQSVPHALAQVYRVSARQ
jgi:hypothetical protein